MKWLTKEYIKEQSEISDETALLCSIEHYDQMLAARKKELLEGLKSRQVKIGSSHCALCLRHVTNGNCPMKENCNYRCFAEWMRFYRLSPIFGKIYYDDTNLDWRKFRTAMREVRRVLQEKYDELYE